MSRRPALRLDGLEVMGEGEVAGNEWLVAGEDIAEQD
jgi:hypothetical protein